MSTSRASGARIIKRGEKFNFGRTKVMVLSKGGGFMGRDKSSADRLPADVGVMLGENSRNETYKKLLAD